MAECGVSHYFPDECRGYITDNFTNPAITHVDYPAGVQTVSRSDNPRFWQLLQDFKKITGSGILINTSFNVRGEPIVCTPQQAYQTFMNTEIDFLVMGDFVLNKSKQKFGNTE